MDDYRAPAASIEAMHRFVGGVPGAAAVLDVHMDDNGGEMLPHLLMADLGRWFVAAVGAGDERGAADFVAAVELLYTSDDPDTRNVAGVSFMELLVVDPDARERAAVEAIRRLAGPATAADLTAWERAYRRPPEGSPERR
jgi:hypothetical protein